MGKLTFVLIALALSTSSGPPVDIGAAVGHDDATILGRQFLNDDQGAHGRRRPRAGAVLRSYAPACAGPTQPTTSTCDQAQTFCPATTAQPGRRAYWVLTQTASTPSADAWTNTGQLTCRGTTTAKAPITVTAQQFRRLPLPAAKILVQPDPDQHPTLVNIATNLLTRKRTATIPTTVLGTPVQVRATPDLYRWDYGDGTARTTADPGRPYPTMPTAHVYTRPGTFAVGLTTTYTGEYSVAGGPWQPIAGTATVPSRPTSLTVVESRSVLVS